MVSLVLVAVVLSADVSERGPDAPARGSVNGPWALVDLSGASDSGLTSPPAFNTFSVGGDLALVGGFGFQVAGVRLSPTARFSFGPRFFTSTSPGSNFFDLSWSPLALALAAPDLLNDTSGTGLRLTPILGFTVPTTPRAFGEGAPLTTITAAGQLERRFGSVELAYRLEGTSSPCLGIQRTSSSLSFACPTVWALSNRLFAEGWLGKSLSLALGLEWNVRWAIYPRITVPGCPVAGACDTNFTTAPAAHRLAVQALGTWSFTEHFGTTLELGLTYLPTPLVSIGQNVVVLGGTLSVWFRTDALLQRNWLDR